MYLLVILEQARRRNMAEQYHLYAQSEEGRAAAAELNRLRAACDEAEAHYLETCARHDAERKAEDVRSELGNEIEAHQSAVSFCEDNGINWEDRNT